MASTGITIDFNANLARFTSAIDKATSDLNRFQSNTQRVASNIKSAFGAIGASVVAIKLASLVKDSIDAADRLYDLSLKTGASVKSLASLDLVATQSGTSIEEVGRGINKLSIFMAQNAEQAKALGITAKDPVQAYIQLADALTKIESPQQRAALASQILGRAYQEQLPLLMQGGKALSDAAKASADYATQMEKSAPLADEFNDRLAELKQKVSAVGVSITNEFLPALTKIISNIFQMNELLKGELDFFDFFLRGINPAADLRKQLEQVNEQLDKMRRQKELLDRIGLGGLVAGDVKTLEAMRDRINAVRSATGRGGATGTWQDPLESERLACIAAGGKWDGKKCVQATTKKVRGSASRVKQEMNDDEWALEERAHMIRTLYSIQQEASEEYEAQLKREFEAEWELIEMADDRFRRMRDAADGYKDLIDPIEKYRRQLEEIEQLKVEGFLTPDQATEALFLVNEQIDAMSKVNEKLKDGKSFAEEFGLAFQSAFEDAIVSGKSFGDVLKALEQDIARIIVRKTVTEPLGNAVSDVIKGIDFGGIFKGLIPSFDVGTPYVPRDTLAFVHKGEAIVPAQYNKPGAMGGVNIVQNISIDSRSDQATILAAMTQAKEAAKAEILASMRRNGTFAR